MRIRLFIAGMFLLAAGRVGFAACVPVLGGLCAPEQLGGCCDSTSPPCTDNFCLQRTLQQCNACFTGHPDPQPTACSNYVASNGCTVTCRLVDGCYIPCGFQTHVRECQCDDPAGYPPGVCGTSNTPPPPPPPPAGCTKPISSGSLAPPPIPLGTAVPGTSIVIECNFTEFLGPPDECTGASLGGIPCTKVSPPNGQTFTCLVDPTVPLGASLWLDAECYRRECNGYCSVNGTLGQLQVNSCGPTFNFPLKTLVRASRRGQTYTQSNRMPAFRATSFSNPAMAPGQWNPGDYDTDYNLTDFGTAETTYLLESPKWRSVAIPPGGVSYPSGKPLTIFDGGYIPTVAQLGDPVSSTTSLINAYPRDPRHTSILAVTSIMGDHATQVAQEAVPTGGWPLTVAFSSYVVTPMSFPKGSFGAPQTWTLLPQSPVTNPSTPRPCTTQVDCDTDLSNPTIPFGNVSYNRSIADSVAPYVQVPPATPASWGVVSGYIRESHAPNAPIWGIPVAVYEAGTTNFIAEKITNSAGYFAILVGDKSVELAINDPNPGGTNPPASHFYYPQYETPARLTVNPNFSGPNGVHLIPNQFLTLRTGMGGSTGGSIKGWVVRSEDDSPINGFVLEVRDAEGNFVTTTSTIGDGSFTFTSLPTAVDYYVVPALDRRSRSTPPNIVVPNLSTTQFNLPNPSFRVRGVPAQLTITTQIPGTFILLSPNTYTPLVPPTIDARAPSANTYYTAVTATDAAGVPSATFSVVPGRVYHIKCWVPDGQGGYSITPSRSLNGGSVLTPGMSYSGNGWSCL